MFRPISISTSIKFPIAGDHLDSKKDTSFHLHYQCENDFVGTEWFEVPSQNQAKSLFVWPRQVRLLTTTKFVLPQTRFVSDTALSSKEGS